MQGKVETRVGIFVLAALVVLGYMAFQIGAFRFDRRNYIAYTMYFDDISGLTRKGEVKIAGVKVGWVEDVTLKEDNGMRVQAKVLVNKNYALYKDSYAIVRQDGLLGPKYLEIIPGNPLLPQIEAGSALGAPSVEPVSIDELLHKFKNIATNVQDITQSLQKTLGGVEGEKHLQTIFENINHAAENIASFSSIIERTIVHNEDNIDAIMQIGTQIRRIADKLENQVLPSFQESVESIANTFDRDFNRLGSMLESTTKALEDASNEAREGFRGMAAVTQKIDEGHGLIGKLINEDDTYYDIKTAVQGLRNYFAKVETMRVVFDTHFESMLRPAENYEYEDSKGFFEVRLYTAFDYFLLFQLVSSEKGFVDRYEVHPSYRYLDGCPVDTSALNLSDKAKVENVYIRELEIFNRGAFRFGAQIGKVFGPVAFRLGIFENSAGVAIDFDIPLCDKKLRWITSLEAFDFNGWNRKNDRRPHLKWLNRIFLLNNIYAVFGADDFVSRRNANIFFGAGLRFGDDDVKYFLSTLTNGLTGISNRNTGVSITV